MLSAAAGPELSKTRNPIANLASDSAAAGLAWVRVCVLWRPRASLGRMQALCGDDFHQTPVSMIFSEKCSKFFSGFVGDATQVKPHVILITWYRHFKCWYSVLRCRCHFVMLRFYVMLPFFSLRHVALLRFASFRFGHVYLWFHFVSCGFVLCCPVPFRFVTFRFFIVAFRFVTLRFVLQ